MPPPPPWGGEGSKGSEGSKGGKCGNGDKVMWIVRLRRVADEEKMAGGDQGDCGKAGQMTKVATMVSTGDDERWQRVVKRWAGLPG